MKNQPRPPIYQTSLVLIILTLIVGITLSWLLRDTLRNSAAQVAAPIAHPTSAPGLGGDEGDQTFATAQATTARPTANLASIATSIPALTPASQPPIPSPRPIVVGIVAYAGHIVAPGETLAALAEAGGSTPDLIAQYNRLDGEPPPGRALIVPRLAGRAATLASAPILVRKGRADKPWVALTLDAGADAAPVPGMLKTLREHNVKITFFLTGKWIKENPDLVRQIVADGHEIANHTFTHPDLTHLDDAPIRKELADTEALMQETAGATTRPLFRPPYGAYDERVLRVATGQGYLPIYWTLDSLDSIGAPKTPEFLLERITGALTTDQLRGAIILAHCGSAPTADALPKILDRFEEMGFEVKKVSEVLGE
jgi:peptidoglycan-N-acetylmuramic acid deacetylase